MRIPPLSGRTSPQPRWPYLGLLVFFCFLLALDQHNRLYRRRSSLAFISISSFGQDPGTREKLLSQVAKAVALYKVEFVLVLGDLLAPGRDKFNDPKEAIQEALRHKALRSIKWIAALGDHEHLGNLTAALDLARTQSRILFDEQYYSLNLQHPSGVSMDLVVTDSVPLEVYLGREARHCHEGRYEDSRSGLITGLKEYLWLSRTLRHSTSDWIVVAGHRPVWSGASRDTCAAELPFQLEMNRLLAERGVDVYISAHDHTAQLIAGDGDVSYIVNGIGNEDPHAATHIPGRTVYSGTGFIGFAIHQFTQKAMTVTWMDIDNSVRSVQVIDSKSLEPGNPPSAQRARNLSKWFDSFLHMLEAPEQ